MTGRNGRRASNQKRSEAKVCMRSSAITTISKAPGKKLKGGPEDAFGVGDDISDDEERRPGSGVA